MLVAVGGGGLIAGCAAALGGTTKIVAIETEGTPTLFEARKAGKPVQVAISGVAADALGASLIGTPNFELAQKYVADALLVTDEAVRAAQRALWDELRVIAEPSGATSLAALMSGVYKPAKGERGRHPDLRRQHRALRDPAIRTRLLDRLGDCYSITSSARCRNADGTTMPSWAASFRLIASFTTVGCSIGMSLGLVPRSSLAAWRPRCRNISMRLGP